MHNHFLKHWLAPLELTAGRRHPDRTSTVTRISVVVVLYFIASSFLTAQNLSSVSPTGTEAQNCAELMQLNLEQASGGPAFITSAQLVDVPAKGLERPAYAPSGYGTLNGQIASRVHVYCAVSGYVAPQSRFELKLPLPADWNQNLYCVWRILRII